SRKATSICDPSFAGAQRESIHSRAAGVRSIYRPAIHGYNCRTSQGIARSGRGGFDLAPQATSLVDLYPKLAGPKPTTPKLSLPSSGSNRSRTRRSLPDSPGQAGSHVRAPRRLGLPLRSPALARLVGSAVLAL